MRIGYRLVFILVVMLTTAGCTSTPVPAENDRVTTRRATEKEHPPAQEPSNPDTPQSGPPNGRAPTQTDGQESNSQVQSEDDPRKEKAHEMIMEAERRFPVNCYKRPECHALLEQALELDPTLVDVYMKLATYYSGRRMRQEASDLCHQMLQHLPEEPKTYICLGTYWRKNGKYPNSYTYGFHQKVAELDPDNADTRRYLGRVLLKLGAMTSDEEIIRAAILHYRAGIEMDPPRNIDDRDSFHDSGFAAGVAKQPGWHDESAQLVALLLEHADGWRKWDLCKVVYPVNLELYPSLEEFKRRILKIRARCGYDLRTEGARHEKAGRIEEAIASFEALRGENPYHFAIYERLPKLYSQMEQTEKARELVKSYFELDVDKADRCEMRAKLIAREYESLAPELFTQLKQECASIKP